ncbi:MAG: hypothetical protein FWG72_01970 [Oscillospiraceae bacterium]|nr:hypothetical protein [Oscillospiraceae bacterium]
MKFLNPIDITVVPGATLTITIPEIGLENGLVRTLKYCLTRAAQIKMNTATGTEVVSIMNGAGGTVYPLLTRLGNIFYADKLRRCFEYRIAYGNNGAPAGVQHFISFNTPKCAWGYDPSNATPSVPPAAEPAVD